MIVSSNDGSLYLSGLILVGSKGTFEPLLLLCVSYVVFQCVLKRFSSILYSHLVNWMLLTNWSCQNSFHFLYEKEKIWDKYQRDHTLTMRKTREFTYLEVCTRPSTRMEYHSLGWLIDWMVLNIQWQVFHAYSGQEHINEWWWWTLPCTRSTRWAGFLAC